MPSRMRRSRSTRIASDAFSATTAALRAIQASTDAFPPLKSAVSAVLVVLELSEKAKSNKKGCEHIAKRSAQLVQDIWGQTKDFDVAIPAEVKESIVQIERLVEEIKEFLEELPNENIFQRFLARSDRNQSKVEEYTRLLDEAMADFNTNLQVSILRFQLESLAADQERHAADLHRHTAVLAVSKMSESERLLLAQIRGDVYIGKHAAIGLGRATSSLSAARHCDSFRPSADSTFSNP
ncbi:hypothetical protein B0H12DRAFT_1329098 [Mycena haematopus]|nr:hypothetical protein B0H12DRAFT_1329098 [Mycena haematopus]